MLKYVFLNKMFKSGVRFLTNSDYRFLFLADKAGMYTSMPDEEYLRRRFKASIGKELNLEKPQTFNEKIQWLKLYDRKPLYTNLVDKIEVKKYVADIIGNQYIIPTLGVWDDPDEINFDLLPDQFVLKCNHNSGLGMCICKDKTKLNIEKVKKNLRIGLKEDKYLLGREWPYKNVKRRILAEKYMEDSVTHDLNDYKFMCFNGHVKCSFVCSDRHSKDGLKVTFFDNDWNVMPFERHYPKSDKTIAKPTQLCNMLELAETLSQSIPFVRVDFYEINCEVYFGELTLYPGSGFEEFIPYEWDKKLGNWLML